MICFALALIGWLGCGPTSAPADVLEVAFATLDVSAPKGVPSGIFTLHFNRSARIYYPKKWGLMPATNDWFHVRFTSSTKKAFYLAPARVLLEWPHEDGVLTVTAGEEIQEAFDVGSDDGSYVLKSVVDDQLVGRLPPGEYTATARFSVPSIGPTRRLGLTVFTVVAPAAEFSVSESPSTATQSEAHESIAIPPGLLCQPILKDTEPTLLRASRIDLDVLPGSAVRLEVLDRIPARELVFAESEGVWELLLENKMLARGWRVAAQARLHRLNDLGCSLDASELAQDLTRVLVDPDPLYGLVVSSVEDLPTNYESSDERQDLERQGHGPASVRSILLQRAPRTIAPPRLTCVRGAARIEYYTWHYFGGEVVHWIVRPGSSHAAIERETLVSGIGSYDYYL